MSASEDSGSTYSTYTDSDAADAGAGAGASASQVTTTPDGYTVDEDSDDALLEAMRMPVIEDGEEERSAFVFSNPMLPPYSPEGDCELFEQALGISAKKKDVMLLVDLLTTRMPEETQQTRAVFNQRNPRKMLTGWVKKRTKGKLKKLLMDLLKAPAEFDGDAIKKAVKGLGTKETVLIEIMTTRSNEQLRAIDSYYQQKYNKTLESALKSDTGGNFGKLLCKLARANREEHDTIDLEQVQRDAQDIFEAGENKRGTDDKTFIRIFASRTHKHLKAVAKQYRFVTQRNHRIGQSEMHHFERSIEEETSGDYRRCLRALLHPQKLLAQSIRDAVHGMGTDDTLLRFALVGTRSTPLRMHLAKHQYIHMFDKHLVKVIEDDTSGKYRKALRRLCATHQGNLLAVHLRENMRGSFHGWGTDKRKVTYILTEACKNPRERADTAKAYELDYGRKLEKSLKTELSGDHSRFLIALSTERAVYDAHHMRKSLKGIGTNEKVLIEILTSRRQFELDRLKDMYEKVYGRVLADDVHSETSGKFRKVLDGLLEGRRTEGRTLTDAQADELAERLYHAGEKKRFGTRDDVFINIFTTHSPQDLSAIDMAYTRLRGHGLEKAVKKETSGKYRKALWACMDPVKTVCAMLRKTMKGLGTNDKELVRLLTHRPREEMEAIKARYEHEYGKTLARWIKADTSGHYRRALLSYIGELSILDKKKNKNKNKNTNTDAGSDDQDVNAGSDVSDAGLGEPDDDVNDFSGDASSDDAAPVAVTTTTTTSSSASASAARPAPSFDG